MIKSLIEKYIIQILLITTVFVLVGGFLGFQSISKLKGKIDEIKELILSPDSKYNDLKLPEQSK